MKKKKLTNDPINTRHIIWAHFLPLPVSYPSGPIVNHIGIVVVVEVSEEVVFFIIFFSCFCY